MSYVRRLFLLLVPLSALLAVGGAAGSPPTPVSGTFTTTSSTFNSVRVAGNNLIVDLSGTVAYGGTFSGTSTINGTLIIHLDENGNIHGANFTTSRPSPGR